MTNPCFLISTVNPRGLIFLILLVVHGLGPGSLNSQGKPQSSPIVVARDSFATSGYQILMKSRNEWKTVGTFAHPTVTMLQKYRPDVSSHFGLEGDRLSLFDVVEEVASTINTICVGEGKIWFGFDFYEGEGWEGYGGIGFYDPNRNQVGVLRHPALIDFSVKSLVVTDTAFYVQTVGNYESASSVGNGLVVLDKRTLMASATVPPGTSTLWDKDDPVNVGDLYNRPISEILTDCRFLNKPVPQFSSDDLKHVRTIGLDSFMVETEQYERAMRDSARLHARTAVDTVLTLTQKERYASLFYGNRLGILFDMSKELSVDFTIDERNYSFWRRAGGDAENVGMNRIIAHENTKFSFVISVMDFTSQEPRSGFKSITLHAKVQEMR